MNGNLTAKLSKATLKYIEITEGAISVFILRISTRTFGGYSD